MNKGKLTMEQFNEACESAWNKEANIGVRTNGDYNTFAEGFRLGAIFIMEDAGLVRLSSGGKNEPIH